MMKKHKGLIIGILIGASLMFSVQSFAEDGLTEITALLRTGLNVTLDGQAVQLDNPSINYEGSTYLKLRDISKITGVGVNWNDATQTVEITSATDSVYGTVTGSVYATPTPEPTPHVSPIPTPTPDGSISALTPSSSDDTIGSSTNNGGNIVDTIYYNYAEVTAHLDSIHEPGANYMRSVLQNDTSNDLTRIITYDGVDHIVLNKLDELFTYFVDSHLTVYRSQSYFLQYLTPEDLSGVPTYHYDSAQSKMVTN